MEFIRHSNDRPCPTERVTWCASVVFFMVIIVFVIIIGTHLLLVISFTLMMRD